MQQVITVSSEEVLLTLVESKMKRVQFAYGITWFLRGHSTWVPWNQIWVMRHQIGYAAEFGEAILDTFGKCDQEVSIQVQEGIQVHY